MTPSELNKLENETIKDFKIRICSNKEHYGLTWDDIRDLINKQTGDNYGESAYRKWWAAFSDGLELGKQSGLDNDQIKEIEDKTLELKKERIKLQSVRFEPSRDLRLEARDELIEEKILKAIENRQTIQVPDIYIRPNTLKRDYLFTLADIHYAANFQLLGWMDEILNEYNPQIAQRRLWDILELYVNQNDIDNINHVHLFNLGDSLDGILRMSQLQWIKMGNVDSAIEFAEFMSTWLNELSKYSKVDYYAVSGNHTELRLLNGKRGDFSNENMEKVVSHIISCNLKDNKNVNIHKCKNHMYVDILGTKVLAVHGHDERNLSMSLTEYPKIYGHNVDLMISGHLHHTDSKTVGMNGLRDIEYIQCQSVVGIDDFSLKIKKTANAGAKLMVIKEDVGRSTIHDFRVK
ncbi:hypothetical protein [Paenibacillus cremeus]|uniref:Calcineurin-like phosphoesterase domain-containing protein n=1 Tax=Paenibacillus cremeus TaxID=2163881 RepID=A0A559KCW9_9BACL|nr:hypothetical protein [Paenibacillus cremeus]TVY09954.1 hypothetical protein FPZ49_11325 [Paenibacillus cremeus]